MIESGRERVIVKRRRRSHRWFSDSTAAPPIPAYLRVRAFAHEKWGILREIHKNCIRYATLLRAMRKRQLAFVLRGVSSLGRATRRE